MLEGLKEVDVEDLLLTVSIFILHRKLFNIFYFRGQKIEDPCNEDGEVVDEKDKVEFDIEKLIDWPGFNSELPREYRDESSKYRAVPFNRVRKLKVNIIVLVLFWID